MRLIRKFESYSQEREEMCKYLCNVCGCSMQELHDKSDDELEMMCRTMADSHDNHSHMNSHNENMNSMDRESMCNYLCGCGYSEHELEMCSDEELRLMYKDHYEEDAYNNDEALLGESRNYNKSKTVKRLREHQETQNYMFFSNLETIKRLVDEMLEMDEHTLDNMLSEHDWASDHISVAAENIEHVFNFVAGHNEPHDGEEYDYRVKGETPESDHQSWTGNEPSHEETEGHLANKDLEDEMRGIKSFGDFKK